MDETEAIRGIIARSFALLAASVHAADPEDQIDIAEDYEHFILTGDRPPDRFDPDTVGMLQKCIVGFKKKR